jgi:hypothetical protein
MKISLYRSLGAAGVVCLVVLVSVAGYAARMHRGTLGTENTLPDCPAISQSIYDRVGLIPRSSEKIRYPSAGFQGQHINARQARPETPTDPANTLILDTDGMTMVYISEYQWDTSTSLDAAVATGQLVGVTLDPSAKQATHETINGQSYLIFHTRGSLTHDSWWALTFAHGHLLWFTFDLAAGTLHPTCDPVSRDGTFVREFLFQQSL